MSMSSRVLARAPFSSRPRWISRASLICLPTFMTGLSEDCGCWKIMAMRLPRILRISSLGMVSRSRPSKMTSPASTRPGSVMRPRMESDVTDFPQPDSPTRPRTSFFETLKSMPVTARMAPARV